MRSLFRRTRVRLTFVFTLLVVAIASVASAAFWETNYSYEYETVDESLRAQADVVRSVIAQAPAGSTLPVLPPGNPRGIAMDSIVIDGSGQIVAKDQADDDTVALIAFGRGTGFPPHARLYSTSARGANLRVLLREVTLPDKSVGGLIIARPIDEMLARLGRVAILLIGGVSALLVVGALLAWRLAGLALAPVRAMSAAAREFSEQDLRRRLYSDLPPDDELGELALTFNGMLARLENVFETLQRFTADAAHELRAPLAVMRSQAEVTLRQTRTAAEYQASHRALLHEIQRLSRIADQLLLLARADGGALEGSFHSFDLADLLEETLGRWRAIAREKRVELTSEIPADGRIEADQDLLRRLFDNLLDNAIRHAPPGGEVRLNAEREVRGWTVVVNDDGPGIPRDARARVFERFYRSDPVRGRAAGGAGLGLALAQAVARLHDGSIELAESGPLPGACFVVRLPAERRPLAAIATARGRRRGRKKSPAPISSSVHLPVR